ncbi:hypothetical protein CWE13_11180 [Aliidiomarina shirensis]|uniref:Uncharacterized protein n=1 Tax=Aliidiomarina shirensis TaxID=1048642 RepID=A0A432WNY4_9GAMM|nr:hypothetical protein [Aliidiomarina shirensis]RUO35485.1 hypothetical protein CWE13_11180 [Aliidiomarina shirensis]
MKLPLYSTFLGKSPNASSIPFLLRIILPLVVLVFVTSCATVQNDASQSKPYVELSGIFFADVPNNSLISRHQASSRSFVRFCEGFSLENEISRVVVNYDCQLDEAVRDIISHSIHSYHDVIMSSLNTSELYKFALNHQPNLCINFIRPQVGFKFSKPIDNCFEMYYSVNELDISGSEDQAQKLNLVNDFNIVSKIYTNWIHEMFHFNYGTNDLDAQNNEHLPFGDRLTNEYLAQLMEVDVHRRVSDLVLFENKHILGNIDISHRYSIIDPDTCDNEDILSRQRELKGKALSFHYSLLGYELAQYTYDRLVDQKDLFPSYIKDIMETLGGKDSEEFFISLLSHCSSADVEKRVQ